MARRFHSALVMMSTKERSAAPARPVAHVLPSVLPHQQTRVLTYMGLSLLPIIGLVPFFAGRDFVPADPSLYS